MGISKELNRGRHCVSALHIHLVFITKYRSRVFESQLTEMHGEDHQVHWLVRYPPKVAVSNLVNSLWKGVSSRMLIQERPDLAPRYWKGVLWSPSYFAASCGDAPLNMLKSYIRQQNTSRGRLKGPYIPGLKSGALRPHR